MVQINSDFSEINSILNKFRGGVDQYGPQDSRGHVLDGQDGFGSSSNTKDRYKKGKDP